MICSGAPGLKYGEFSDRIHQRAMAQRIPLDGTLELTFRCNLSCRHCYCLVDPEKKELSFQEVCRVIDEIAAAGCLWLLLTGGEPLVRPDFLDIYTYARKKGLIITLFSNATLLTKEIADQLRKQKPFVTEITLYGMTQETYESMTGVPGSFKRCLEGIGLLRARAIPFKLKTCVTTLNQHELADMRGYARELGVEFRFDPVINPRIDGAKAPCDLRITPGEVVAFELSDERRVAAWRDFLGSVDRQRPDYLFTCGGGRCSFQIDPYGELQLCALLRRPSFNLREGSFRQGWQELFPALHAKQLDQNNKCWRCEYFPVCDQCPGWAYVEEGDQASPVSYLCQIAHERARHLLKEEAKDDEKALSKT